MKSHKRTNNPHKNTGMMLIAAHFIFLIVSVFHFHPSEITKSAELNLNAQHCESTGWVHGDFNCPLIQFGNSIQTAVFQEGTTPDKPQFQFSIQPNSIEIYFSQTDRSNRLRAPPVV